MVTGTTSDMNLNEVAATLARLRNFNSTRVFSVSGRGLVELRGDIASELWDLGEYHVSASDNTTSLMQPDDGPYQIAAYPGRLPGYPEGHHAARKMLEVSERWRSL